MTIPVGAKVRAAVNIPYIEENREIPKGTPGTITYYYEIFDAYQVKFVGFAKEMMVVPNQIERA